MVSFALSQVENNDEGWGPTTAPPQFANVPFMPFSKGDRLGRIADFGMPPGRAQYQNRYQREPAPGTSMFNFERAEEDELFELVDNKPVKKTFGGPQRRGGFQQQQGRWGQGGRGTDGGDRGRGGRGGAWGGRGQQGGRGGRGGFFRQPWYDQQRTQYSSSVDIRPEWHVLGDQIALTALHKLSSNPGEGEELVAVGNLAVYDRAADRVTPKNPAKLGRASQRARSASASEDPVLNRLAQEGAADVFITDDLLTVLMCAPRSVYPWDIVITRREGKLFFDRRPGSSLEFLTNGETAPDELKEEKDNVNGVMQLSAEATGVNQAFRQQVLASGGAGHALGEALPSELAAAGSPPPGYRYRRWTLGDVALVARCEVDACVRSGDGSVQTLAVHTLNEFDPKWSGVDWRQKLENQRGAVLATELKNNANKMARWTAAALIGGVDIIKLGYVSRTIMKDNRAHMVLGTQAVKPRDFAAQMNLNMDNAWGIVRALVGMCMEKMEQDGKYLLVRDPNKPQLRLYAVPAGGVEAAEEEDGAEEEEADE